MKTLALSLALTAFSISASPAVSVDRHSFNPTLNETVSITVKTPPSSRVSVLVLDRDGFVTRTLANGVASSGTLVTKWDGRDTAGAIVADEAYSFKVDVVSAGGKWSYFPA